jgi:hypothetical protein
MKRNLLKGIILISVVALSSCSTTNKLAGTKNVDDDVYFTKAKSGDYMVYASDNQQNNYSGDNDYYYYGDYASRISKFNYFSPFDYNDDFYYNYSSYSPYSSLSPLPNTTASVADYDDYSSQAYNIGAMYSPYDYGYSDYYMGGYDDLGYGNIYSSYIFGGGGSRRSSRGHNYARMINRANGNTAGNSSGAPLTFHKGRTGVVNSGSTTAYYPGNPNRNSTNGSTAVNGYNNRPIRSVNDNPRQAVQSVDRPQAQQSISNSNSSSGSSGNSSSSAGGGGRPVRP